MEIENISCYEKVLNNLPAIPMNERAKKAYILSDTTLKRVNKLNAEECKGLYSWVSFQYDLGVDFEDFIIDYLNYIEKPKLDKMNVELKKLKSVEERVNKNALLSKRDIAFMLGVSLPQVDIWLKDISNPIPSIQLKEGGAIKFRWSEVEAWVDANNVR